MDRGPAGDMTRKGRDAQAGGEMELSMLAWPKSDPHSLPPMGAGKYPGKGHATTGQAALAGQVPRQVPGKYPALAGCRDCRAQMAVASVLP